ncbi:MAG: hypothetical protein CM15mP63_1730 [Gammaproteobacteria bacterium]|nr:MAG: hypothetical protein CM15mP63_1730 [Gammaproteobacteria bacterium]
MSNNQKYLKEMGLDVEWYFIKNNKNYRNTLTNLGDISSLRKKVLHCKICNLSSTRKTLYLGRKSGNQNNDNWKSPVEKRMNRVSFCRKGRKN